MPVPNDWNISCKWEQDGVLRVEDPRGLCPFCRKPTTFQIQAMVPLPGNMRMANTLPTSRLQGTDLPSTNDSTIWHRVFP
jgi:hypothetical protein